MYVANSILSGDFMKPYKNKKIGEYIRKECVCCITGKPCPVNHHIIGNGYSGIGTKAPDYLQAALSHELHMELHDKGWKSFESKYGRTQKSMVAETMINVHSAGVINLYDFDIPEWFIQEVERLAYEL